MENIRLKKYFPVYAAVGFVAVSFFAMLYSFSPAEYSFYPQCLVHSLTGLNCVGCGSLRAMHQLLHGNLSNAWQLNSAFVLSFPVVGVLVLGGIFRAAIKN